MKVDVPSLVKSVIVVRQGVQRVGGGEHGISERGKSLKEVCNFFQVAVIHGECTDLVDI